MLSFPRSMIDGLALQVSSVSDLIDIRELGQSGDSGKPIADYVVNVCSSERYRSFVRFYMLHSCISRWQTFPR